MGKSQSMYDGYTYGLSKDEAIGWKELEYWSLALPLRRVLANKVAKFANFSTAISTRWNSTSFARIP